MIVQQLEKIPSKHYFIFTHIFHLKLHIKIKYKHFKIKICLLINVDILNVRKNVK